MPKLQDFFDEWSRFVSDPNPRVGQSAWIALEGLREDLAERVDGTLLDPFYDDTRLPAFLAFVVENWSTYE